MNFYINGKKENPIEAEKVKFEDGFVVFENGGKVVYAIAEEFIDTIGTDHYNYSEEDFENEDVVEDCDEIMMQEY